MIFGFLGDPAGFSHWFLVRAHLPTTAVQDVQHVLIIGLVTGLIVRPFVGRAQAALAAHHERRARADAINRQIEASNKHIATSNQHIANLLDTNTPGGLAVVRDQLTALAGAARSPDVYGQLDSRATNVWVQLQDGTKDVVERRVVYWEDIEKLLDRRQGG